MLIITDVETLYRIPDNELNKLTSKDRVVIFSRAGSQMPMSKFQALASIKGKMEIKELPSEIDSMEEADQLVYSGYLFGTYAATVKPQEPVKIYSALFDKLAKASAKAPNLIKSMGKIQLCGSEEKKSSKGTGTKKPRTKKADAPVKEDEEYMNLPVTAKSTAKPVKNKRDVLKNLEKGTKESPLIEKMCSMGLSDMKTKLVKNEEQLTKAIKDATDAAIGYKFQLTMVFGDDDAEKIWGKTNRAFEQLKKLV